MDYERESDGSLVWSRRLGEAHVLSIRGSQVRQTPTGAHAQIVVTVDGVRVTSDLLNLGRDRDRIHLAGSAGKHLTRFAEEYPRKLLEHDLMQFCEGLWGAYLEASVDGGWTFGSEELHTPNFRLRPYIPVEGGVIFYAPPKSGKSYLGMLMSVSVDAGCSSVFQVEQAPALFINLERGKRSMEDRLAMVNRALGLEPKRRLLMINARGRTLVDVAQKALGIIREHGVQLVFVDSLSRAGVGNLVDNAPANVAMDTLNGLAPCWGLLAHTARGDASHVFGSQMFDAAADVLVQVMPSERNERAETRGIGLKVTAANDIAYPSLTTLAFEFNEFGLAGVRHATLNEFPDIENATAAPRTPQQRVSDHFFAFQELTLTQIANDLRMSKATVSRYLAELREAGVIVHSRTVGSSVFYKAAE